MGTYLQLVLDAEDVVRLEILQMAAMAARDCLCAEVYYEFADTMFMCWPSRRAPNAIFNAQEALSSVYPCTRRIDKIKNIECVASTGWGEMSSMKALTSSCKKMVALASQLR